MWIGVIGDTNGFLNPLVLDVFSGVDYILHSGDIGHPDVLDGLSLVAPVAGVVGQSDIPENYPFTRTLFRKWFEVGVYVNHRIGDPMDLSKVVRKEIEKVDPQVVIFGHSQEAYNTRIESRLFFNPGAAGKKRSKFPRSVGLLEIDGRTVRGEIVLLDGR